MNNENQNPQQAPEIQPAPQPDPQAQPAPAPQPIPQPTPQPPPQAPTPQPPPQAAQPPQMQNGSQQRPQQLQRRPGQPGQPIRPIVNRKPPNTRRLIFGCLGCSGFLIVALIVLALIFVGQTQAGDNALARSLGMDPGTFINTLIDLVNVIFGAVSLLLLMLSVVGIFQMLMARKDDKEARKRGLTLGLLSGFLLFVAIVSWIAIYLYMDGNRVPVDTGGPVAGIYTIPEETLGLTAPITIEFDASYAPINTRRYEIISYSWDFGDGAKSTVPTLTHTYSAVSRYEVQLQITKRDIQTGEESTDSYAKTIVIQDVQLTAVFEPRPQKGPAPLTVSFDATGSLAPAGEITAYEWDFDNDNVFDDTEGKQVEYEFSQIGTYKVSLRITDNAGKFAISSQDITVEGANAPVAVIDIKTDDGNYYVGKQYSFTAENSKSPNGKVDKFEWNFGDGTPKATTRTASHIYKNAGDYEVTLKITDETGKTAESAQKIRVEIPASAPIAVITTVPPPSDEKNDFISGSMPFEVNFSGTESQDPDRDIVEYKWDFDGDGNEDSAGETASYVYKEEGSFNATLTVVDSEGNESVDIIIVRVETQPLTARITADPYEGVFPLTVTFDASSSSYPEGQIVGYEWDFGDGSPKRVDASKVTYKYTSVGTFNAYVTTLASDNSKDTATIPINVRPVSLSACFDATPSQGPAPLEVEFDPGCSTGTVINFNWDFGDGKSTRTRKPRHTYGTPGTYTIQLEVSDNQNVLDTYTKTVLVTGEI